MEITKFSTVLVILIFVVNADWQTRLLHAEIATDKELIHIYSDWMVAKYPNFLKSVSMSKYAWDFLKMKFRYKILSAEVSQAKAKFPICYMGSSVTAGHDIPFNKSVSILVGHRMSRLLKNLNVIVDVRNAAFGSNPCFPYDICPKVFCGDDIDLVHWEQSYNCGFGPDHNPTLEQFLRQSMDLPSNPVIAFVDSITPNWQPKECPNPIIPHVITAEEQELLQASTYKLATELNKNENWIPHEFYKLYKGGAIQSFKHYLYDEKQVYRCQGPYHQDWGVGVRGWHPSVSGHRLRADQHTYFWLSIWKAAILDIRQAFMDKGSMTSEALLLETKKRMDSMIRAHRIPVLPKYTSNISDSMQCFTNYVPRHDVNGSISRYILSGMRNDASGLFKENGWYETVREALTPDWKDGILKRHIAGGYLDYKNILVAEAGAPPLSISITPRKLAPIFICEPVNVDKSEHIWELKPLVYISENVTDLKQYSFSFEAGKATMLPYIHVKSTGGGGGEICVQTEVGVSPGTHVLTIAPVHKEKKKLMIATLMLP